MSTCATVVCGMKASVRNYTTASGTGTVCSINSVCSLNCVTSVRLVITMCVCTLGTGDRAVATGAISPDSTGPLSWLLSHMFAMCSVIKFFRMMAAVRVFLK